MRPLPAVLAFITAASLTAAAAASPRALLKPGASAGLGYEVVVGETAINSSSPKQLRVACPAGKRSVGAGWGVLDPTGATLEGNVSYFEPAHDGSSWLANAQNRSTYAPQWKLRLRVICVSG